MTAYIKDHHVPSVKVPLDTVSQRLILTTLYFEIFSYPLTIVELKRFVNYPNLKDGEFQHTVDQLCSLGILKEQEGYFMIKKRPDWVKLRHEREARARRAKKRAERRARLISRFPFIRAVFFSGTYAKGIVPLGGDIDFFIVTKPGRLWVGRTLLIFFKKIFLLNSRRFFCVNYFVDEDHLEIEEKNLFTATEIATLAPAFGPKVFSDFMAANAWIRAYYPNIDQDRTGIQKIESSLVSRAIEQCLSGSIGDKLDVAFYRLTSRYWTRKFEHMDQATFDIALKSQPYISKHHPNNFQDRVLSKHNYAIEEFEKLYDVRLRWLSVA